MSWVYSLQLMMMTIPGAVFLQMLMENCHLSTLSVTCNRLGEAGGKLMQEGMEDNKTLLYFDLRLTGISQESEYCINQMIKTNLDTSKAKHSS